MSSPIAPISFKLLLIKKNGSDSSGISFIFCNNTHFTHNTSSTTRKHSVPWIIDSGATNHIALIQQPISASDAMGNILVQPNNANLIQVPFNERNDSDPNGISFIFSSITQFTHNTSSATCKHSVPWIIDSGATNHIASSLKCFSSYSKINPIQINLPNKSIVTAYISGTIIFSPNFILHDVLFVLEFHFNLLSTSKLLKTRKFTLIFDDFFCTIQDKHSLQMIGLANLEQGLYQLNINKEAKISQPKKSPSTIILSTPSPILTYDILD